MSVKPIKSEEEDLQGEIKDGEVVVSIIGNSSWQIGMACLDLHNPVLSLYQVNDDRLYTNILTTLENMNVKSILVPKSHANQRLVRSLYARYDNDISNHENEWDNKNNKDVAAENNQGGNLNKTGIAEVLLVSRKLFNEDSGMEKIMRLQGNATSLTTKDLEDCYLARAAAAALLDHIAQTQGVLFMDESLLIKMEGQSGRIFMDGSTINDLELLRNRRTKKIKGSLVSILDLTLTKMGGRLLRQQILTPPNNPMEIRHRQNSVKLLLAKGNMKIKYSLEDTLASMHDLDLLTTFYCVRPSKYTPLTIRREVDNAIRIREVLICMPKLCEILKSLSAEKITTDEITETKSDSSSDDVLGEGTVSMFESMGECISSGLDNFCQAVEDIDKKINVSTEFRHRTEDQRQEALFAIKKNFDGLLDVARCTYSHTLMEIRRLVQRYNNLYPNLSIQLSWTSKRGYHLTLPQSKRQRQKQRKRKSVSHNPDFEEDYIPHLFVERVIFRSSIRCTTEELLSLNRREEQAATEILERTTTILGGIRSVLTKSLPYLFMATECISLLDLVLCISAYANEHAEDHVFPRFGNDSELLLKDARHPIMEEHMNNKTLGVAYVCNSIQLSLFGQKLALIFGANGSGKSTLIKMVAIISIMGAIGFPVPAKSAKLPYLNSILTRIGTQDNIEGNASTFNVEMSSIAHILSSLSSKSSKKSNACSLVLIDELGRGTSVSDGTAIAWACCEALLKHNAYTLFVSHFSFLHYLAQQLPRYVKQLRFKTESSSQLGEKGMHMLEEGRSVSNHDESCAYGIHMATLAGMPYEVTENAKLIRNKMIKENEKELKMQELPDQHCGNDNSAECRTAATTTTNDTKGISHACPAVIQVDDLASVLAEIKSNLDNVTLDQKRELLTAVKNNTALV